MSAHSSGTPLLSVTEASSQEELALTHVRLKRAQLAFLQFYIFVLMFGPLLFKWWQFMSQCFCIYLWFYVCFFMDKGNMEQINQTGPSGAESAYFTVVQHLTDCVRHQYCWCVICLHSTLDWHFSFFTDNCRLWQVDYIIRSSLQKSVSDLKRSQMTHAAYRFLEQLVFGLID